MNRYDILTAAILVGTALMVFRLWKQWFAHSIVRPSAENARPKLDPESRYLVDISDEQISCTHPDGTIEAITKSDLNMVEIATTEDGPFAPDVFWLLHAGDDGVLIPWGATGEQDLLAYLQSLPNFQNEAIVNAASLVEDNRFLCWKRMD